MVDSVDFTDIRVAEDTIEAVVDVLESGRFVKGPLVERFENRFAETCGVDHAVAVSSGTAAILLALEAAGIGEGDSVFVPGHTFFASASPVLALGATPVFVDVDPETYTMDPDSLATAVAAADNPAAVIPVHIYGGMADVDAIDAIASEHDLFVVEDSCQAHFASRDGATAGTVGDAGAFSFYPSKNMTVGGDGGMAITDDADLAETMRMLRNHGRGDEGVHRRLGLNYRLDETNAAVGLRQLDRVRDWSERRRAAARRYTDRLADVDAVTTPFVPADVEHVFHLYVIQVPDREALADFLADRNVDTGVHYPTPAHQHPAIVSRVETPELPVTESLCDRILSLPMHPRLTDAEVDYVCSAIEEFYQ
ncbi:DegT/DnrJ/EryC1/StrS family aminotransferase [Halobellus rufus]|uniref:DegT/DnrJ/EryC1/StrS family aminotransferase n=1 Tax=Halobellus rufus TaxID=1448860 RepID=UPI0006790515|nr:DegT/DnrJ/EryC1/StrS family aminotransferase [Halobellus rufus]